MSKYKTIYMAIPYVASHSISKAFMQALELDMSLSPEKAFKASWACSKYAAHCSGVQHWFKFAFVRNPFDRLVTCWIDKTQRDKDYQPFKRYNIFHQMTFNAFVRIACRFEDKKADPHWRRQTYDLLINDSIKVPDFIGKFERLKNDWERVQKRIPDLPDLQHYNKLNHRNYREYYTDGLREMVEKYYAKDLIAFGYVF